MKTNGGTNTKSKRKTFWGSRPTNLRVGQEAQGKRMPDPNEKEVDSSKWPRVDPDFIQLLALTIDVVAEQVMDARNQGIMDGKYFVIHVTVAQAEQILAVGSSMSALAQHAKENT
jgi:hypothetical protein